MKQIMTGCEYILICSFAPIVDKKCTVLILGSMPGVESLRKQQYYGNNRNAFWKIMYSVFNENLNEDYEQRIEFILKHNIALWDVLATCEREGSADADIRNPVANDFVSLFNEHPGIGHIYFNGSTAKRFFNKFVKEKVTAFRLEFDTLPSTSPANAIRFETKLYQWMQLLDNA